MANWHPDSARGINRRFVVEGKMVLDTPASFSNGETTGTEIVILEDALESKALLPGASLAGALRHYLLTRELGYRTADNSTKDDKRLATALFGEALDDNTERMESRVIVNDALVEDYRAITTDKLGNKEYRYPSHQMQGGYLQRGDSGSGWVIQPAKSQHGESIALVDRDVIAARISETPKLVTHSVGIQPATARKVHTGKEGVKLHIAQANGISKKTGSGYEPATLIISNTVGKIGGKGSNRTWYPAIYEADKRAEPLPISQTMWDDFIKDRDLNRGIANRKLEKPGDVLFYLLDDKGELLFFGPTMFFRIPYGNSIGALMPTALQRQNTQIDYAEAMFGYVSEKDETRNPSAYAGRISMTSAKVTEDSPHRDNPFDETVIPKILSSPKPTTFQHYLEQPNGKDTSEQDLHHYGNPKAKLRGHKLYWRQMIKSAREVKEPDNSKNPDTSTQHTIIQPVRPEVEFAFKLHFENLSDAELGALIWVLTLGGEAEARHQLGMGKPLGLGVVKLEPELILTKRHERETGRYGKLFDDDGSWLRAERCVDKNEQTDFVNEFKNKIPDFDEQQRIKELMALVQKQEPSAALFSYMQITPDNDYQGRPVLPTPTEVAEQIEANMQAVQEQQRLASIDDIKARIQRDGLDVGDIIGGNINKSSWLSDGEFWFSPRKFYHDEGAFSLSQEIRGGYEAFVSYSRDKVNTREVKARIVEIDDSNQPIQLICEWVD